MYQTTIGMWRVGRPMPVCEAPDFTKCDWDLVKTDYVSQPDGSIYILWTWESCKRPLLRQLLLKAQGLYHQVKP